MSELLTPQAERTRSPLRRPVFLRLWLGLMFSRLGDQLTTVALIWFVLQLTGSGLAIGLIVLCFQLPAALSSPLMGTLLDHYQPRLLMALDNISRTCIIAAIPLLYLAGALQIWMIYALALCAGVLTPATGVGLNMVIPRIVANRELERANALAAISWDFSTLLGPALAGVLILFIGAPIVLFIDTFSFLLMGFIVLTLPLFPRAQNLGSAHTRNFFGFGSLFRMKPSAPVQRATVCS